MEIRSLLVAVFDWAFAVSAARCAGCEGEDWDGDFEGLGDGAEWGRFGS